MIKIWSLENKHNNFSICTIEPGETNTKLRKKAFPGADPKNSQDPIMVAKSIVNFMNEKNIHKGETIKLKYIEH